MARLLRKKLTGLTNNQIGRIFDNLSYSAVVKAHQRMSAAVNKKKDDKEKGRRYRCQFVLIQGVTPFSRC